MLFDSPVYFVFLLAIVPVYWALSHRRQNSLLLAASYLFYGWWDWRFLGLILASTLVDFFCAQFIADRKEPRVRKVLLMVSLVLNFAFLGFFKYFNFFADSLGALLSTLGLPVHQRVLDIVLPPGISFYTFQAVAYIVDVYYGRLRPSRSLVDYALFITLFPHLIAGPIQRPSHLLPQVEGERRRNWSEIFDGMMLILTGLFRKTVVADNCALVANAAFDGRLGSPSLPVVLLGTYAFAWQIYGDFSGYSDIARGSAQLMGFHFMVNFSQPYLSRSLQDFWRRWHISLSTWLRDYLYIPLGGSRDGEWRTYRNLLLTMLLGGLWHGANWTFVVWGGLHGGGLALERWMMKWRGKSVVEGVAAEPSMLMLWIRRLAVFHVVCLAWVFFRAESVGGALHFLGGVAHWEWRQEYATAAGLVMLFAVPMAAVDLWMARHADEYPAARSAYSVRIALAGVLSVCIALGGASASSAFIYFQF